MDDAETHSKLSDQPARTCILVVGMHRSGTSALTRVVNLLGAALPKNIMGLGPGNKTGHWEPIRLVTLHDHMLAEAGSSWDDWRPLDLASSLGHERLEYYRIEIRAQIEEEYGDASLFVIKDPRISRFVWFYREILASLNIDVRVILMMRNPLSVAGSLEQRNEFGGARSWLNWLRHVIDAEAGSRTLPRAILTFEALLEDWRKALSPVAPALELEWPQSFDTVAGEIDTFLSLDQRHHAYTPDDLDQLPIVAEWIKRAFFAIGNISTDPKTATDELDAIAKDFESATGLFAQILVNERAAGEKLLSDHRLESQAAFAAALAEKDAALMELKTEFERLNSELGEAKTQVALSSADKSLAEERFEGLRTKASAAELGFNAKLQKQRQDSATAIAEVRTELNVAMVERNAQQAEVEHLLGEIVLQKSEYDRLLGEFKVQMSESRRMLGEIDAQKFESKRLLDEIDAQKSEVERLLCEIVTHKSDHKRKLQKAKREAKKEIAVLIAENSFLVEQNLQVERKIDRAKIDWTLQIQSYERDLIDAADLYATELRKLEEQIIALHGAVAAVRTSTSYRLGQLVVRPLRTAFDYTRTIGRTVGKLARLPFRVGKVALSKEMRAKATSPKFLFRSIRHLVTNPSGFLTILSYHEQRIFRGPEIEASNSDAGPWALDSRYDAETLVSLVIVNFNGKHHFPDLLKSLAAQTHQKFEVIVVDNASADDSVDFLQRSEFPVKVVPLEKNTGFAEGNNVGFEEARGELLLFLNNDTRVAPTFIEEMIGSLNRNPTAAAVGPKIRFFCPYIQVDIEAKGSALLDIGRLVMEHAHYPKIFYQSGFSDEELRDGIAVRQVTSSARLLIPEDQNGLPSTLRLSAKRGISSVRINIGGKVVRHNITAGKWTDVKLPRAQSANRWLINNAGSFATDDGIVGDRGYADWDDGKWDDEEAVTALCGCAILMRREALADGEPVFPTDYFAYFEDTDLSLRLRRKGYKLYYCPTAVVYHKHASTSGENSPFFRFYVNRNRQLFYAANYPADFAQAQLARAKDELNHIQAYYRTNSESEVDKAFAEKIDDMFSDWHVLLPKIADGSFYQRKSHFPRFAVYNRFWNSLGGGEYYAAIIAEALQQFAPVDLLGEVDFDIGEIERQFGLDLSRCRKVIFTPGQLHHLTETTSRYDLLVNATFGSDLKSHAANNFYVIFFPYSLLERKAEAREFLKCYNRFIAISEFVEHWSQRFWGVDCDILYPSIHITETAPEFAQKEKIILSVGRFFTTGHNKKQLEMVNAFVHMRQKGLIGDDWKLILAGQVESDFEDYFLKIQAAATGFPIELRRNVPRAELNLLYDRAAIYWHAAGLNENIEENPVKAEHFGITILEGMLHCCIPVVIDSGGPPEIVGRGRYGFVFSDLSDMYTKTSQAVDLFERNAAAYRRLVLAAREHALGFGKASMQERFLELAGLSKENRREPEAVASKKVSKIAKVAQSKRNLEDE